MVISVILAPEKNLKFVFPVKWNAPAKVPVFGGVLPAFKLCSGTDCVFAKVEHYAGVEYVCCAREVGVFCVESCIVKELRAQAYVLCYRH